MQTQNDSSFKNKKDRIYDDKINLEKDNLQYNCQDLDQEQNMNVNPVQLNTQDLKIIISNNINNYSGKITGTTYLEKNKEIAPNIDIKLFFGHKSKYPVYKTKSDCDGNFTIGDLPSGYYTLLAKGDKKLESEAYLIKIFIGQTVHQTMLLK